MDATQGISGASPLEPFLVPHIQNLEQDILKKLSSSTPLSLGEIEQLYKLVKEIKVPDSHPFAIIKDLYSAAFESVMEKNIDNSGINGSYFFKKDGQKYWVFKPENEEVPSAEGIAIGMSARREHLASVINRDKIFPIPDTFYVDLGDGKIGSLQRFVESATPLQVIQTRDKADLTPLSIKDIQSSIIFDIRFNNADRHLGNLLATSSGVYMIDHGQIMSDSAEDIPKMHQTELPQALADWDQSLVTYVLNLDDQTIEYEASVMRENGISNEAILRMKHATMILKEVFALNAESSVKITPYDLMILFRYEHKAIWNLTDQKEFLKDIIKYKDQGLNSRAKILMAAKKYQGSESHRQILFSRGQTTDEPNIDLHDSILGKLL